MSNLYPDGLEVCSWCHSSLSQRPLHTRYCHLRSSASAVCSDWHSIGSTRPDATGQRSFTFNGPATCNCLPLALWSPDLSESTFKRTLKMHPFLTARCHWDLFMILAPDINIQTCLLTYLLCFSCNHLNFWTKIFTKDKGRKKHETAMQTTLATSRSYLRFLPSSPHSW